MRARSRKNIPRDAERHDASPVGEEQPADRTAEEQFALAVLEHRVPAHQFREREPAQCAAKHRGKHVDRGFAALLLPKREIGALRSLNAFE